MIVVPGACAVIVALLPDAVTVAIVVLSDDHVYVADVTALPLASRAVAVTASALPMLIVSADTDTATRVMAPGPVGWSPPPAHAASPPSTNAPDRRRVRREGIQREREDIGDATVRGMSFSSLSAAPSWPQG